MQRIKNKLLDKNFDIYPMMETKTISLAKLMEIVKYYLDTAYSNRYGADLAYELWTIYNKYDVLDELQSSGIKYLDNCIILSETWICVSGDDNEPITYTKEISVPLKEDELKNLKVEIANVLKKWEPYLEVFTLMHTLKEPSLILSNKGYVKFGVEYDGGLYEVADRLLVNVDQEYDFSIDIKKETSIGKDEKDLSKILEQASNIKIRFCDLSENIKSIIYAFIRNIVCQGDIEKFKPLDSSFWCDCPSARDLHFMEFYRKSGQDFCQGKYDFYKLEELKKNRDELNNKANQLLSEYYKVRQQLNQIEEFKLLPLPDAYFIPTRKQNDTYLQIVPELLEKNRFKLFNWDGIDFQEVSLQGLDLSGSNIQFDPQTIYQKDLTNTNCSGLRFPHFRSWDGVLLDGAVIDDWEAMIYLETVGSINQKTKLYSCYYKGKLYKGFEETSKAIDLFLREKEVSKGKRI